MSEATPLRARRRRIASRFSAGHLVMIVAGLVGMLLTLALLRNADDRVEVAVAAHDLRPGEIVSAADLRYERVNMDGDLLGTVLGRDDVNELDGAVAVEAVGAGELVSRTDLARAAAPSGLRAVSIPIDRARAVDGAIAPGDRVDVLLAAEREVVVVVAGAEVLDVGDPSNGPTLGSVDDVFTVTLAVDARGAQLLTAAITDGDVLLARSTGAESAQDLPPLPVDFVGAGGGG
ncbi:MAG TPA: Flp pilus assembly protein CpaB [Acidimicrobiia bacterium]